VYGVGQLAVKSRFKKFGGLEAVIEEVEAKEGLRFLSRRDRLLLVASLYLDLVRGKPTTLREVLAGELAKLVVSTAVGMEGEAGPRGGAITSSDVVGALAYLKLRMTVRSWPPAATLSYVLRGAGAARAARLYARALESVLSSFNLATSFSPDLLLTGSRAEVLRITSPGALFLDLCSGFRLGEVGEGALRRELSKIIDLPGLALRVAVEALDRLSEATLQGLALEVRDAVSSYVSYCDVRPYTDLLAADLSNLLALYEGDRLDLKALIERMLVRWRPSLPRGGGRIER